MGRKIREEFNGEFNVELLMPIVLLHRKRIIAEALTNLRLRPFVINYIPSGRGGVFPRCPSPF